MGTLVTRSAGVLFPRGGRDGPVRSVSKFSVREPITHLGVSTGTPTAWDPFLKALLSPVSVSRTGGQT